MKVAEYYHSEEDPAAGSAATQSSSTSPADFTPQTFSPASPEPGDEDDEERHSSHGPADSDHSSASSSDTEQNLSPAPKIDSTFVFHGSPSSTQARRTPETTRKFVFSPGVQPQSRAATPDSTSRSSTSPLRTPSVLSSTPSTVPTDGGHIRRQHGSFRTSGTRSAAGIEAIGPLLGELTLDGGSGGLGTAELQQALPSVSVTTENQEPEAPHDVKDEDLPDDRFHHPDVQNAFVEAKALMSRLARVLGSSPLHIDPDSAIKRLHKRAEDLSRFQCPSTRTVGFVGDSGVGKTLASNSGAACTCVVTEYHYDDRDDFQVDVELFSQDDLMKQVTDLLQSYRRFHLHAEEMTVADGLEEAEEHAVVARDTFRALFRGRLENEAFLATEPEAHRRVFLDAHILSKGLVLVDLPGSEAMKDWKGQRAKHLAAAYTDSCRPERCDEATVRPHEEPGVEHGTPGSFTLFEVPEREADIGALPATPIDLFLRYVPYDVVDRWAEWTNAAGATAQRGPVRQHSRSKGWRPTSAHEIYLFLGILISMGLHTESQIFRYWSGSQDQEDPIYLFTRFISWDRFQLLLRRLQIFNPANFPDTTTPSQQQSRPRACEDRMPKVYRQVNEWSAYIQATGDSFYTPGSGLTVDEAMVRFTGRSVETTTVPSKPTPVGFKVWVLAQKGYCLRWLWHVHGQGPYSLVPQARPARGDEEAKKAALTPTQRVVTTLVALLPVAEYHVFLDNLFASVKLFRALRRQNIGATGTCRKDGGIDDILVGEKEDEGKGIPWGQVHCIPTKDGQ
ncbi:hypothetical protein CKAH01_05231, partial [Colletotrichum kahawae]